MQSQRHDRSVAIPNNFILATLTAYTAGADIVAPPGCRGLLVGVSGAQSTTMAQSKTQDLLPLCLGVNPGRFIALRSAAGNTAADIWFIV